MEVIFSMIVLSLFYGLLTIGSIIQKSKNISLIEYVKSGDKENVLKALKVTPSLLEERDAKGNTPIIIAASLGYTEIVAELIHHGAEIHAKNVDGMTALMKATQFGHTSTVKVLLDFGANVRETSVHGWSPILLATAFGQEEVKSSILTKM